MEFWFTELHTPNVKFSVKVDKHLYTSENDLGRVDIFESPEFGRFLAVDGYIIFTQRDEFIYDEMLSHIPMAVNPNAEKVLVFGSGDGGVVRELLKYQSIQQIDLIEINEGVVQACREYFPEMAESLDDPRVTIYTENALRYIRHIENEYDLIVVDSAGFYGPGESLLTREFYGSCYKALKADGIMVNQHQSPFYEEDPVGLLALWLCIQEVPSGSGSGCRGMEQTGYQDQLLHNKPPQGLFCPACIRRAHACRCGADKGLSYAAEER